jgi:S-adenosylmethionine synthetase
MSDIRHTLFASESVTEGHPDKVADHVSDAVLDAMLDQDPNSRVACETLVTTGLVLVAGEVTTRAYVDIAGLARRVIADIGYTGSDIGFDAATCAVLTSLHEQSPDISQGVTEGQGLFAEQGAGDQGMMFGFATDEGPDFMPTPISLAHRLSKRLSDVRRQGLVDFFRPDGKTQVSVRYDGYKPVGLENVLVSTQHAPNRSYADIREAVIEQVIKPVVPAEWLPSDDRIFVNPTGAFVYGGPAADTGLTGRKIIMDTYGGMGRHGGGAFSGKDPTKVDRSAAYMCRYVAKNLVAAGLASRLEVQVSYAIGKADPLSLFVETFGTGKLPDERILAILKEVFDFRPKAIIEKLDLRRPVFLKTAAFGHFGRDLPEFTWERTDMVEILKDAAGL